VFNIRAYLVFLNLEEMSSPMGRGTEQLVLQVDPLQKHVGLTGSASVVSQGQAMTALLLEYSKALHEYE
jgi:hypothetical protein